ncbi:MAG: DsbA family protein [Hyphomicrobium sp.]
MPIDASTVRARGLAALLSLLASGCGGEGPKIDGVSPGAASVSTEGGAGGSAFPDAASAAAQQPTFNPFGDPTAQPVGGRVIIEQPTRADIMAPGPIPEMALGRNDAPVTIVQYASLTCPHCRVFHRDVFPQLKRAYIDTGKVRFILREFPIGKQSGNATIALRCVPADKYFALYGKFMEQQDAWVSQEVRLEPIFKVAAQVGLKQAQFDACLTDAKLIDGLKAVKERGRKLGIIGTPNFFVSDKLVKSRLTMADLKAQLDPLLAAGPVAGR